MCDFELFITVDGVGARSDILINVAVLVFCVELVQQNNLVWDIQANNMEGGVEELVENTTVIAVNVADQADGEGDRSGSLLRPGEPVTRTNSNRSANDSRENILKGKKLGHRRVKDGEVTFKKFETTQLMGSIQLGIQQSVGNLASQEDRDLLHEDFYTVDTVVFSRDGSLQKTPAHNFSQFKVNNSSLRLCVDNYHLFSVSHVCPLSFPQISKYF